MKKIDISAYLPIEEGKSRSLDSQEPAIFLVQSDGCLYAYQNRCPHLGIELNWMPDEFMESGGNLIICSTHGALFKPDDGLCISGPCQGDQLIPLPLEQDDKKTYILLA
jgi:nitrite reductase/ring-hydroxylating ferredoxin subunit